MRLAIAASHPVQYYAPLFRAVARRLDVTVFYAHRVTPRDQAQAGFGVGFDWDVDLLSGYRSTFLTNVAREPSLVGFGGCDTPEIGRRLAEGRFDAVLVLGWQFKSYIQAIAAAKRFGLPVLARGDSQLPTRRSAPKRAVKRVVYPPLLRLFDAALYVGERSRAYWTAYGYPSLRLFFSPHAVDAAWFAERATDAVRAGMRARLDIGEGDKVVLFAGKLVAFKRPLDVVMAASLLRREGMALSVLVAGAGPLSPAMSAAAREQGVPLHDLGFCNQTQMPAAYAAADVLALPSDARETWGMVANEALACGRPLALSDAVGAAPDLVGDGMAGRAFPAGDVDALADALRGVIERPPSPEALERKSRAYSLCAAADGIEAAVAAVLFRRNSRRHSLSWFPSRREREPTPAALPSRPERS